MARLLRVPLFYKILLANAAIVAASAAAGSWISTASLDLPGRHSASELVGLLVVVAVGASVAVNALILRLALRPLKQLERTAARVGEGDADARVPASPLADRGMERLRGTFNEMLDRLAGFRERLRGVAARALRSAEEERKRIARELHDDTAQRLVALHIRLQMLRRKEEDPDALRDGIEEVGNELRETLEELRHFAQGLRPPSLDELGLVAAVQAHARNQTEAYGIPIRVEGDAPRALSGEEELVAYRIVQEALTNALRHADASEVRIRFEATNGGVRVSVTDDGRGFDVDEVLDGRGAAAAGLGLFGMRERAAYVGGEVDFESREGEGARVVLVLPGTGGGDRRG